MKPVDYHAASMASPKPSPGRRLPKLHVVVLASLAGALGLIGAWPSDEASASRQTVSVALPVLEESQGQDSALEPLLEEITAAEQVSVAQAEPSLEQSLKSLETAVKPGDSLSTIFKRAGLSDKEMYEVISCCKEGKELSRLYPGHKFVFWFDADNKLTTLEHVIDRLRSQSFTRSDSGYTHQALNREPDTHIAVRSSVITSSLYAAGVQSQVDEALIMELAGIFGWDIDFALDIRSGDTFKIAFEEHFLDGERIGTGRILAAEFVNQNEVFRAVRYVDEDGYANYYTPEGKAMRKAFLRAPLDFRRISSNFNPRRLHPIHKTVRPHRGTDYAANRGTPVWASGDGKVIASGYSKGNGNYVVIQHGNDIQTKYLHLDKRHVKQGDRVRQKQMIGTVGNTGYSTAPHLHYEFLVDGVHRDPRTILEKLPKALSIEKNELPRFYAQTQAHLAELDKDSRMAAADSDGSVRPL